MVAPDRNLSGTSNALSVRHPLYVHRVSDSVFAVEGTPVDCVHLATTRLLDDTPDIVISGINHGANMGDDVLYSGTVAAATFFGLVDGFMQSVGQPPGVAIGVGALAGYGAMYAVYRAFKELFKLDGERLRAARRLIEIDGN